MANKGRIQKIIIVGAGPTGLLLSIMLAKEGINVQLLEATHELDKNPRAAHYAPSAVYEFTRAGVIDEINAQGMFPDAVAWRLKDGTFLAGMGMGKTMGRGDPKYPMVVLPLDRLGKVLLAHLLKLPNATVLWGHKVVGIEQDEREARVKIETRDGPKEMSADYVLGCDGANSQIRRSLFGDQNYPGETLPEQIIATNVYFDFTKKFGYWDSNFIIHPTDWYMAARITNDGLWRVTYGDIAGLSKEEYLERLPQRYQEIFPSPLMPGDYKLVGASPYKLQQRCAPSFRIGRFILVADAAHLCNPFGGLGLTGGFADVGSLYDCLVGINRGLADEEILDKYSEIRIKLWREMIDPQSRANFHRLWDEEAAPQREAFFAMARKAAENPDMSEQATAALHAIRHDFTQYYKERPNEVAE